MYLLFPTKQEAQKACDQIFKNIRVWLKEYYPIRVHPNGLISVNADGTPNLTSAITIKWAEPEECQEGWYFPKPKQENVGMVPIEVVLVNVGGETVDSVTPVSPPQAN